MLNGKFYKTGEIVNAQFLHEMTTIGLNGFLRQEEKLGYLCVRFSFYEELQDFPFTGAEAGERIIVFLILVFLYNR